MKEEVKCYMYRERRFESKQKECLTKKTDDLAVKERFITSSGWIQNFMKRHLS